MSIRLLLWLVTFVFTLLSSYWFLAIMIVTWVAYWYPSWWLFILVVLLDGYFGAFYQVPVLSLAFGFFVIVVEVLKIQLREAV